MRTTNKNQRTITKFSQDAHLLTWLEAFLIDRKAQGLAQGTIGFYKLKLGNFADFCESQAITQISQIDPNTLRQFLMILAEEGHNPGGIHAFHRAIRTFLYWWEDEVEPIGWKNPIRKVKAPKIGINPLEPADTDDIKCMLTTCEGKTLTSNRDKAILLSLVDTGLRASELVSINLVDLEATGAIFIRHGKGNKPRTVYLGKKSRRAVRAYLKYREDDSPALWITISGNRLTYWGLRQIIRRRAEKAGVTTPPLHSFRRLFALECLRNGMDIYNLQHLMGHADLQVLRRYLAITEQDTEQAHRRAGPVDNAGL
jgi:site-specific recombinase XerD